MSLKNNVYVMNDATWEKWKDGIFEEASKHDNPMPYMRFIAQLEIVVDNYLKDNIIEVYDKKIFEDLGVYSEQEEYEYDPSEFEEGEEEDE